MRKARFCSGSQNQDTGITCFHSSSCRQGDKPPLFPEHYAKPCMPDQHQRLMKGLNR